MSGEQTLYSYALEIMEKTCPYDRKIADFQYATKEEGYRSVKGISICEILKKDLMNKKRSRDARYALKYDNEKVYPYIEYALIEYYIHYPASHSFRMQMLKKFQEWMKEIWNYCGIKETSFPKELTIMNADTDTAIAMVKVLQKREGLTRKELAEELKITDRSVHINLRKLDRDLCEWETTKDKKDYIPFRVGGQPVQIQIREKKQGNTKKYYTPNSLHPIVLQENLTQAGILLQALARNYAQTKTDVNLSIALDIWYQLTDYAKERIRMYFAENDQSLAQMLDLLDNDFPDDHFIGFMTEEQMVKEYETMSEEDAAIFLSKVPGRNTDIRIVHADGDSELE